MYSFVFLIRLDYSVNVRVRECFLNVRVIQEEFPDKQCTYLFSLLDHKHTNPNEQFFPA